MHWIRYRIRRFLGLLTSCSCCRGLGRYVDNPNGLPMYTSTLIMNSYYNDTNSRIFVLSHQLVYNYSEISSNNSSNDDLFSS